MFCLFLFSTLPLAAVDFPLRWRWSNPAPHGGNVVDMAYSPLLSLGVQVAERGQIYTTANLDLWLPRDTFLTNALRAVTFFGQRIVVTGENGAVLYADDVDQFQTGTLIDGATTDWLEAVTASPGLCVAAGDNGAIYTSTNGATWMRRTSGVNTWFRGAATGAGNFVVVGEDGVILTSPNGASWTARASGTSRHLNRVHFANVSGRFTAVGEGGVTLSSTNGGTNWFTETTGATNILQYATSGGLDRIVDGVSEVRVREQDSGIWSDELAKTNGPPDWTYFSAIGLPNFFLVAGQTGLQSEGYQVNGAPHFWLTPFDSVRNLLWDVTRQPGIYVAAGDYGTIMSSGNGVDWTLELTPASATNSTLLGVGGNTNLLLAVGDGGTTLYSPNILTNIVITNGVTQTVSSLGVLWYAGPKPTTNDLQGVAVLSNSLYVITGGKGDVFTSPDGTNWTPRASTTTNLLSSVTEWPGGLVASGDNGTILTSANGLTWTRRLIATTNWLYRVRWLNKTLIAVGQNGTILTSTDATVWTNRPSGTANWLTDVAFGGDTWFASGLNGTVLTSSNLVNWTPRGTLTKKPLYAAASDAGQLIVVGAEGVILRSQIIPDLTPVSFLGFGRVSTNSVAYNIFLFGGKPDQRFTLDRATNLVESAWTTGPTLEIFDGSGTLYYLESISGTNIPPIEYYRARLTP